MTFSPERLKHISHKLSAIEAMRNKDQNGEPVSWNTAYSILEILESLEKIKLHLLPIEGKAITPMEIKDHLDEIESEISHISYHINDAIYFKRFEQ
jgi:hypothetical protein